jgi:hypothetical protein
MLRIPNLRPEDIRWIARVARARGDQVLARDALLRLVQVRAATEAEERALRAMTEPRPAPPAEPAPAAGPARVEPPAAELLVSRDGAGRLAARLAGSPAAAPGPVPSAWQREWADLPPQLADQLAVCVLTRVARTNQVTLVTADGPSTVPLATAIADAVGARTGRPASPSQETDQ